MRAKGLIFLILGSILLSGCQPGLPDTVAQREEGATSPTAIMAQLTSTSTPTLLPPTNTPTATLTPTATATPNPLLFEATVWHSDPLIPILNYHRFLLDTASHSTGMRMRLSDFLSHLARLYDAGYTLITLDDLLSGNLIVPEGRRPLVLSIDDGYFADQLFLDEDGEPSPLTGIGVLYDFYQQHPDFGFEVPMFVNFGDKYYGNYFTGTWWVVMNGWEDDLAQAIVWGIEHGVIPYNHTYRHERLDLTQTIHIESVLSKHDQALRSYLARADRLDLVEEISNYIALPYGIWPADNPGIEALKSYTDPEGQPVRAIFEAGYEYRPTFALAPFSEGFDPMRLPRMAGIIASINFIVEQAETLPTAETCTLVFEDANQAPTIDQIKTAIMRSVTSNQCSEGLYIMEMGLFRVENGQVIEMSLSY